MIETPRLILRPWREDDKPAFRAIINTPAMMEHFGGVAPPEQIDPLIDAQMDNQADYGFSMWAVDDRATGDLAGICGLRKMPYPGTQITGDLEAGWRIAEKHWGTGVAREAAQAAFESAEWSGLSPAARARLLWRAGDVIEAHADELAELETRDQGQPLPIARHDANSTAF